MAKDFSELKAEFNKADLNKKIQIYTTTKGLTVEQFKELLQNFPIKHLNKLEKAMA
ncbi:MAG: hypothetical protein ACTHVE_06185 [Senegalia sp. (in: firmicutes)]|uniref:hypothetical protein n=1 Tax=Senegalia sp. (in: firmicutes) TaxID=1924098 RepID=UPI003F94FE7B